MAAPQLLIDTARRPQRGVEVVPPPFPGPWSLLGIAGAVFLGLGALDIALAWFPADFSSAEWEFGTITASANGLPLPGLGLLLIMAGGIADRRRWQVRAAAVTMLLATVVLLTAILLYVTVVPVALGAVDNALVRTGLTKAVTKALVLLVVFPGLFTWLAIKGWRGSSHL